MVRVGVRVEVIWEVLEGKIEVEGLSLYISVIGLGIFVGSGEVVWVFERERDLFYREGNGLEEVLVYNMGKGLG